MRVARDREFHLDASGGRGCAAGRGCARQRGERAAVEVRGLQHRADRGRRAGQQDGGSHRQRGRRTARPTGVAPTEQQDTGDHGGQRGPAQQQRRVPGVGVEQQGRNEPGREGGQQQAEIEDVPTTG
ncbi:hypothetical protein [Kitasatospora sp. MAA4]|uniref:hypothetical protein n=1 Tax=Kitasatospora sp. MAA4 TaxID=3035093 RepID=UPI002473D0C1|nr:hypothetical protein [Kitasatospora sp. MAA4]